MLYDVRIPNWTEGKPMTFQKVEAASTEEAKQKIVDWHNRRAGYHYCDDLPSGTEIAEHGMLPPYWPNIKET